MTAKNVNKSSARDLAAMTGMPYQSCLTTVQVLRALPAGVSLADLEPVLTGSGSGQALLNLPGSDEVNYQGVLPFAFSGDGDGDGEVIVVAQAEPALAVRTSGSDWGLPPSGASLWLEMGLGDDQLRPAGVWRTTVKRLLGAARSGTGGAAVLADPAEDIKAMAVVLGGEIPGVAYISPRLDTVAPSYTTAGPGFDWAHFSFVDLDQVHAPDEQDHRLVEGCGGNCGWLHDWPTTNLTHTQISMPVPLVDAYQRITASAGPDPDGFDNERWFRHGVTADGTHWYGLGTYPWHSEQLKDVCGVWMRVDPPAAGSAPFPLPVS
ncbi:hypothetical protein GCM10009839_13580 [Catenulispora yoronensis]|uniref:Uncharacterized protein n=1 Tax=Catenulispora yoronensis TaxID=450799 RepID=A0ABP5F720_9ACTN